MFKFEVWKKLKKLEAKLKVEISCLRPAMPFSTSPPRVAIARLCRSKIRPSSDSLTVLSGRGRRYELNLDQKWQKTFENWTPFFKTIFPNFLPNPKNGRWGKRFELRKISKVHREKWSKVHISTSILIFQKKSVSRHSFCFAAEPFTSFVVRWPLPCLPLWLVAAPSGPSAEKKSHLPALPFAKRSS